MKYRPEIDGLRALAVVPVILFHAGANLFPGGYVGVDVFFVISGYLITTILVQDLEGGRYSIARFYERRARRILPALVVVTLATIPPAFLLMLPEQIESFAESVAAVGLFLSNFYFLSQVGYFAPDAELQPLLHTWSLAVEEQFYLLFPPALALLWRWGTRRTVLVLALVAIASLALAEWGWRENPARNFFFTGGRVWELMAGALAALLLNRRPLAANDGAALVGLGLILGAILFFGAGTPTPSLRTAIPVAGAVLVILFAGPGTLAGRLLSASPVVWVGLLSYSAYLWHQPLFALARIHWVAEPPPLVMAGLAFAVLPLSWLTWRWVEQPFRRPSPATGRPPLSRPQVLSAAAVVCLLALGFGLVGKSNSGFAAAWASAFPDKAGLAELVAKARSEKVPQDDGACRFNRETVTEADRARLNACFDAHGPGIAVLGDSHAIDLFGLVVSGSDRPFVAGFTKPACRPGTDDRDCPYESFKAMVGAHPGLFQVVIFEMSGAYLLAEPGGPPGVQNSILRLPPDARAPDLDPVIPAIDGVVAFLKELQTKVPVVWFGPRLEPQVQTDWVVHLGCEGGLPLRPNTMETFAMLDGVTAGAAGAGRIPYLSQMDLLGLNFPQDFGDCDGLLWSDGDHFSARGEVVFGKRADVAGEALAAIRAR